MRSNVLLQQELPLIIANGNSQSVRTNNAVRSASRANKLKSVCLFSSAGLGELGLRNCGMEIACANEIIPYRVELYRENFPNHNIIEGDIWKVKSKIIASARKELNGKELFLLYATPPCQGMSSNGMGRLKWEISQGRRKKDDPRNRLIIPTADLIVKLRPRWVLLENVPGMQATIIHDERGRAINIIDYLKKRLGKDYVGKAEVVACEDYGIPQKRKRLVTIFTRDERGKRYYSENGGTFFSKSMKEPRKTLRDAISHLPELDAVPGRNARLDFHPYHFVNALAERKYSWISNTVEGDTAFNNQCINPKCMFQGNPKHRDEFREGKWTSGKKTPIHCVKCGELLPRPFVMEKSGKLRLLKGFHSAYRRMKWDEAARTLTQNFIYEASDNKVHPEQNRVLSLLEALIVQSIERYGYRLEIESKFIGLPRSAEIIGESVPPYLIEKICSMMVDISHGKKSY